MKIQEFKGKLIDKVFLLAILSICLGFTTYDIVIGGLHSTVSMETVKFMQGISITFFLFIVSMISVELVDFVLKNCRNIED